jgi:hypothetical protein
MATLQSHNIAGPTAVACLLPRHPGEAMLGIFIAHKLLWVVWLWAILLLLTRRRLAEAGVLMLLSAGPLATVVLAMDTSRVVGFGFAGMLAAIHWLTGELRSRFARLLFVALLVGTILIPYIPTGVRYLLVPSAGVYRELYFFARGLIW